MDDLISLGKNSYLWIPIVAWFAAQITKVILGIVRKKRLDLSLLTVSGGMPSSHSAMVCALAASLAVGEGLDSPLFAIATVTAFIVMYDAFGVRRAVGEQAKTLNNLITILRQKEDFEAKTKKIKEILGHKPLEVFVGALIGITTALIILNIMSA